MVIALIQWKIKPDRVDDFLNHWRKEAIVQDRRGLIGEFLSEACHMSEFPWITWNLGGCDGVFRSFVNVGMWSGVQEFQDQVGNYFVARDRPKEFEYEGRTRTILRPACWRVGDSRLPGRDSDGTL